MFSINVLALPKLYVFTPLYRGVRKRRCEIASTSKSRCWSLIFHQWSFAWFGCCPMKNQFEIHSLSKGTSMQAKPSSGVVFLSCSVDTKQSSGEGGCTVRTKYNVNTFVQNCKHMSSNTFEMTVAKFHWSFVVLWGISIHDTALESLNFSNSVDLQLLVKWLLMRQLLIL